MQTVESIGQYSSQIYNGKTFNVHYNVLKSFDFLKCL